MAAKTCLILLIPACLTLAGGCGENTQPPPGGAATEPSAAVPQKAGAELWADNCSRCHNAPPPDRFSDAQWDVIMRHMRLRADLTGNEQRKIAEFLKASH